LISIGYHINPKSFEKAKSVSLDTIDAMSLHYDYFLGDILFRVGEHNLDADWGWVPVLDFAICMRKIVHLLDAGKPQVFEFTESDAYIKMEREGSRVVLYTNYKLGSPSVPVSYHKLDSAVEHFYKDLIAYLTKEFPTLKKNSYIQSLQ
jgi:hypothetical protein